MNLPELDALLFFLVNLNLQNSFFDLVMPFITKNVWMIFLPLFLWCAAKDRKTALLALVLGVGALLLADWTSNTLKHFFGRVRPCHMLDGVRLLVGCGESFSMPSSHAVNAFAFMTPFYLLLQRNRIRYLFLVVAVTVGFSRVYVGVHYPSDVLAGALIGMLVSVLVLHSYRVASKRFQKNPLSTVLTVSLICIGLFRIYYIQNGPLELSPDEAHYWEWSRRLDLSYYSKGPMIAYLIHLGTGLFGDTVFGIRIMAVVFSTLSSMVLYFFGRRVYDEKAGLLSALIIQIIPLFSAYGVIFTIDSPFIFFWILALFLFGESLHQTHTAHPKTILSWSMLGLSVGLGLLTKYSMAFFYPCAFLFLLISKETRKILLTKGPYLACILSILIFSPVIVWNATRNWVTLRHTAGQVHIAEGLQISPLSFLEFIGSQLGVITPLLLILMIVALVQLRRKYPGSLLFWFSVPVIGFFLLKSVQGKVQANWALPGYVTGIVAFAAYALKKFLHDAKWKRILTATALSMALTVTSIAHYPAILNLPVRFDPAARLTGWKDLGSEVSAFYEEMLLNKPVFIFSDRYQISSQLAFYVRGHPVTYCINGNRRMNQYDLWPSFHTFIHSDAIFVRTGDVRIPEHVAGAFEKVEKKVFTAYTKKHAKIRDYSIFLCYDFKGLDPEKPVTY
jgi:4-amino-4-deoxy-L-arabinose transferase-like glycosyltransferase/membrane-associated phospholipid phosphatase